jgi:hypothetical protein
VVAVSLGRADWDMGFYFYFKCLRDAARGWKV